MLIMIAAVLAVVWALGLATSNTFDGFIHVLIILALVAVVSRVAEGSSAKSAAR